MDRGLQGGTQKRIWWGTACVGLVVSQPRRQASNS